MIFGSNDDIEVYLKGVKIEQIGHNKRVKSINILGIEWDNKLKWDHHINKICGKVSKGLFLLKKFGKTLLPKTRVLIYEALIRSHLIYDISIWGNSNTGAMNRLRTLQKKAIKSIEHHKTHTEPIC